VAVFSIQVQKTQTLDKKKKKKKNKHTIQQQGTEKIKSNHTEQKTNIRQVIQTYKIIR
jgi:hypothetical protein